MGWVPYSSSWSSSIWLHIHHCCSKESPVAVCQLHSFCLINQSTFSLCVLVLKVHFFIFSNQSGINYCLGQFSPQRPSEDPFKPGRQGRVSAAGGCAQADPPRHLSASPRQTKKTCLHSPAAVRWSHDCCPHRKKRHQKDEKWCTQSIQRT